MVIHSLTKFINGSSDTVGGVYCASQEFGKGQVGMHAALKQNLVAAQVHGFLDLGQDVLGGQDIAAVLARSPEERAELAGRDADVGIVDITVHDIGHESLRVHG